MQTKNKKGFLNPRMIIIVVAIVIVLYFGAFSAYIATEDTQYGAFRQQAEYFSCSGYKINLEQGLTKMRAGDCQVGYDFFKAELNAKLVSPENNVWQRDCINQGYALRNILDNYYCSGGGQKDDTIIVDAGFRQELSKEILIESQNIALQQEVQQDIIEQQTQPAVMRLTFFEKINLWISNFFSRIFGGKK